MPFKLDRECDTGGQWANFNVTKVRVRATWLGNFNHASFTAARVFAGIFVVPSMIGENMMATVVQCMGNNLRVPQNLLSEAGKPTHWWVEITTDHPNVFFCIQFRDPDIYLSKHNSLQEVTDYGKSSDNFLGEELGTFCPSLPFTMNEVYNWLKFRHAVYDRLTN